MATFERKRTGPRSPKLFETEAELYNYAVGALGRITRTVMQLRRLLQRRVTPGESGVAMIEAVLSRLQAQQYLSDTRYAASYSALRKENQRLGKRRVAQDLMQKGVPAEVISRELELTYSDTDEETQARAFLARKRTRKPTDQRETARVFRMLARAGFSGSTAMKVLKQWDLDPEALAQLAEADL